MPEPTSAHQLRQRAAELRRVAQQIERNPVARLDALAGDDTWRMPAADVCRDLLASDLQALHQVVDDLRLAAWRFEVAADALATAAASRS